MSAIATVRGDPFCRCGFNLHGRPVVRDGRTDLPLAECPECGAFHAAGAADTAVTQWAARFYAVLVLLWVALLVALAFAAAGLQAGLNLVAAEDATSVQLMNADDFVFWRIAFLLLPLALGSFLGAFQSVSMWHRRGPSQLVPVLFILAVGGFITELALQDSYGYRNGDDPLIAHLNAAGVSVITLIGWAVMLRLGRPLARAMASVAVPPKPRRALAFLWTADGKSPPTSQESS